MSIWDGFATDMAINGANQRANNAVRNTHQWAEYAGQVEKRAADAEDAIAQNLAIRFALAAQLERIDPDNPILKDTMLLERLKEAGSSVFAVTDSNYDAAREVGRTFKIPGREGPFVPPPTPARARMLPPTLMKQDNPIMNLAYASTIAHRNALVEQLKRVDPNNPLLKDAFLVESIRNAGAAAYTLNDDSFDAAREAGTTFSVPQG